MKFDIVIIGSGIIGMTIAYQLKIKDKNLKIAIIDKEPQIGMHASGLNSGVLHAGFYYKPDSLKAKFTKQGNLILKEYCKINNIPILNNGKLVVTTDENEFPILHELERRARENGVNVSLVNEKEALEIEPMVHTLKLALYSPTTSTVDPNLVCRQLMLDLKSYGVQFFFNTPYLKRISNNEISTGNIKFSAKKFINAAGLYADKIAHDFGVGKRYCIFPLRGRFIETTIQKVNLKTNIYPVPNFNRPFLGVHFVVTPNGKVKIGPTATPAFWRENYSGIKKFDLIEFLNIFYMQLKLFKNKSDFRELIYEELHKLNSACIKELASKLVTDINLSHFRNWSKPGVRAQLLDLETLSLAQDFIVEKEENSIHILNIISPGFTSSFAFSKWIVENYL